MNAGTTYSGVLDSVCVTWRAEGDGGDLVVTITGQGAIRVSHETEDRGPQPSLMLLPDDWETVAAMIAGAQAAYSAACEAKP